MFHLDVERIRRNVVTATTEDLLDRVTVYRPGMEPEAVAIIEAELKRRGVSDNDVRSHAELRQAAMEHSDRIPRPCQWCDRPAEARIWTWFRLWGIVPIWPWRVSCCSNHRDASTRPDERRRR
jgi:hypothetical protein